MGLVYMHREPDWGCGAPAFRVKNRPVAGTPVRSADFTHLDGTPILPCSPMTCDTCGRLLMRPRITFLWSALRGQYPRTEHIVEEVRG